MTKVLFTGITGLLGKYFLNTKQPSYEIFGTYNKNISEASENILKLDITQREAVISFINEIRPQIVVHAASIGNVDYCETHEDEAGKVNVEGTKNILDACFNVGAKIIFTSSNAIYDGANPAYDEESKVNPLDVYGRTKVEGEKLIRKSNVPYVILRLMTMYGWQQEGGRSNPVTWVINELKNNKQIKVVDDIYNNHLYAGQAAEAIWKVIESKMDNKIYNVAGRDCISRYDLAIKVSEIFNFDSSLITPVKSNYFKNIAPRPKNTCFSVSKIEKDLKIIPLKIAEGLEKMKNEK